jgi:hypothetical protein
MTAPEWQDSLFRVLTQMLRSAPLEAPVVSESEEVYTDRVLVPAFQALALRVGDRHLLVGGHHTGINRPIVWAGSQFHPDISLIYRGHRLVAVEVKILRGGDRSGAISKAVGQAVIYATSCGFGIALIVDSGPAGTAVTKTFGGEAASLSRTAAVLRHAVGGKLLGGQIAFLG